MSETATGARPQPFPYVQALRALAALSVAFDHVAHDLLAASAHGGRLLGACWRAMPWAAGVDIFFVISGFVIVHATQPLFGTWRGPARFLFRRIVRIVPLYWATTLLFMAVLKLVPGSVHGAVGGADYIAKSFLFIPARRPDGLVEPVFGLGWTLDFEMLFYVVLTPFVLLRRGAAVAATVATLALLTASVRTGVLGGVAFGTWASPIISEFCVGMGIALLVERVRLGAGARLCFACAAVVAFAVVPAGLPRPFAWGGPAAMLVAAAALGRDGRHSRFERALERLGDASYALYLVHPFVMRPFTLLWRHVSRAGDLAGVLLAAVEIAAAQIVALLVHRRIERPVTQALRRFGTFP